MSKETVWIRPRADLYWHAFREAGKTLCGLGGPKYNGGVDGPRPDPPDGNEPVCGQCRQLFFEESATGLRPDRSTQSLRQSVDGGTREIKYTILRDASGNLEKVVAHTNDADYRAFSGRRRVLDVKTVEIEPLISALQDILKGDV